MGVHCLNAALGGVTLLVTARELETANTGPQEATMNVCWGQGANNGELGVGLGKPKSATKPQRCETLDRIARGETVAIELLVPDTRDAVAELGALGVRAQIVDYPNVDVLAIRQRLALTQAEFAIRFGLELDAVQSWEQGHQRPDPAARVLLKVIEQNPAAVDAALAAP